MAAPASNPRCGSEHHPSRAGILTRVILCSAEPPTKSRNRAGDYRAKMKINAAPSTISAAKPSNSVADQLGLDAGSIIIRGQNSMEKTFGNRTQPSPPPRRGRGANGRRARRRFLRSIDPSPAASRCWGGARPCASVMAHPVDYIGWMIPRQLDAA